MTNDLEDKKIREKLIARGIQTLTDVELLSIIIQDTKQSHTSTVDLATRLLAKFNGNLNAILAQDIRNLRMEDGLGIRNAASVLASLELGRRAASFQSQAINSIQSNTDIYKLLRPILGSLAHEEFWVVYLSASNGVLDKAKVSQGGVNSTTVDHKLIIKRAVELLACGLVIAHNHPSGNATPSKEDIELTNKLIQGASLFDINVIDHVIITSTNNISFKQLGLI